MAVTNALFGRPATYFSLVLFQEMVGAKLVSGTIVANDRKEEYIFTEGDFQFSTPNHLARYVKLPPLNGQVKTVAISFDQKVFREVASTYE